MNDILYISLDQIAKISILLNPIIPKASSKVLDALNIPESVRDLSFIKHNKVFKGEISIKTLDILFKKFN